MEFLYHDKDLAVVIKPVGLDSESAVPAAIVAELGGECYTVHRLDLNVGGVMVYARTKSAAAALSRAIQDNAVVKEYVALVHGEAPEEGDWTDLLLKDARKNKVFVVDRERKGVKSARLTFTRLETDGGTSLVRIRLYTGRSHQIRVQFASHKHPLVGDHKYGARDDRKEPMLFSCCLTFPWKGRELRFEHLPDWAMLPAERLSRIAAMEEAFVRRNPDDLAALAAYMDSGDWRRDYEADEQGRIPGKVGQCPTSDSDCLQSPSEASGQPCADRWPKSMNRGVLSQDGLYNLLEEAGK